MEETSERDYENPWYYKGTAFTSDDIGDKFGYVYCITNLQSGKNTLDENILHSVESLQVGNAELQVRVTGKSTTEVLQNLSPMLNDWAKRTLSEK